MARVSAMAALVFIIALATAAPVASAGFIPTYGFQGEMPLAQLEKEGGKNATVGIITGAIDVGGTSKGVFGFLDPTAARGTDVTRVEVYDTRDISQRDPNQVAQQVLSGVFYAAAFDNASFEIAPGTSFIYYAANATQDFDLSSPFALSSAFRPPTRIGQANFTAQVTNSVIVAGDAHFATEWHNETPPTAPPGLGTASIAQWVNSLREPVIVPFGDTFNITITDGNRTETFAGRDYAFRFLGHLKFDADAPTSVVPLGLAVTAAIRPGDPAAVKDAFNITGVQERLEKFQKKEGEASEPKKDIVSESQKQLIDALAPVLNGALILAFESEFMVHDKPTGLGKFSIVRFQSLNLEPGSSDSTVAFSGEGKFILAGNKLYTEKSFVGTKLFPMPPLSIGLWVVAAIAIVLSLTMKPLQAKSPGFLAGVPIRILGIAIHVILLIIAFILWDMEVHSYLGISALRGGMGVASGGLLGLELLGFAMAGLFFGLPVRFIINSGLKFIGMKQARGLGKGLGNLSQYLIGAAYIPLFLGIPLDLVFKAFNG